MHFLSNLLKCKRFLRFQIQKLNFAFHDNSQFFLLEQFLSFTAKIIKKFFVLSQVVQWFAETLISSIVSIVLILKNQCMPYQVWNQKIWRKALHRGWSQPFTSSLYWFSNFFIIIHCSTSTGPRRRTQTSCWHWIHPMKVKLLPIFINHAMKTSKNWMKNILSALVRVEYIVHECVQIVFKPSNLNFNKTEIVAFLNSVFLFFRKQKSKLFVPDISCQ